MSLLQETSGSTKDPRDASKQLESLLVKQLLLSSGVFKGSGAAGSSLNADLFADALADAVAGSGELGLAHTLDESFKAPAAHSGQAHISSNFGARIDPITHQASNHPGVDLAEGEGTPIIAAGGGIVRRAGERGGYGNAIEIDHGGGLTTLYAHASALLVKEGQHVQPGDPIAQVGHTGRATGDHLHFEVRVNGTPVDPLKALKTYGLRVDELDGRPNEPREPR